MRFLFYAHNRRGLGHLMRGLNLAREIRALAPSAEILFYTRSRSAETIFDGEFPSIVANRDSEFWYRLEAVQSFLPDVVVYDTLVPSVPPRGSFSRHVKNVCILRKCKPEKQLEVLHHPFLELADLILIPHTVSEFNTELPKRLCDKSIFVGPIVRSLSSEIQKKLLEQYQVREDHFVLVSTPGGGGFEDSKFFFNVVFQVHEQLHPRLPMLRHLVVRGPNYEGSLDGLAGMTVIPFEPELANLFAISNLVIAEGGYNTVNEIRLAKVPAVFLPALRNYDDQEERVRHLERAKLSFVFAGGSPDLISQKVVEVCMSNSCLKEIKIRYQSDRMETGNRVAAEKIIGLVAQ